MEADETDRMLECRGGPLDGAFVRKELVDERGNYYEFLPAVGEFVERIGCYEYDAGTDCLHYRESAKIANKGGAS